MRGLMCSRPKATESWVLPQSMDRTPAFETPPAVLAGAPSTSKRCFPSSHTKQQGARCFMTMSCLSISLASYASRLISCLKQGLQAPCTTFPQQTPTYYFTACYGGYLIF